MIKKLNKHRARRERPLTSFYFETEHDYVRLLENKYSVMGYTTNMELVRFAIANTKSFETKTQLKFSKYRVKRIN